MTGPVGGRSRKYAHCKLRVSPFSTPIFRSASVAGHPILASGGYAGDVADQRGETTAGPCGGGSEGMTCPTGFDTNTHLFVQTRNSAAVPSDHSFYVAIFG